MADELVRRWRPLIGPAGFRSGAVALAAIFLCLVAGAGTAQAQYSTVQIQGTYQAYNLWQGWNKKLANKCTKTESLYVNEPTSPGQYPVLVYLHGTLADWNGNVEGQRVTQLAAAQGFVAAAFTYSDITPTQQSIDGQANCMFNTASPGDAISQVCAIAEADCSNGFVVVGFSAGGAIAMRAENFNQQVQAVWAMGVNGPDTPAALAAPLGTRALPNDRLRIDDGERDVSVKDPNTGLVTQDVDTLNALTGNSCSASPCLTPDGSGYYVVQDSEVADGVADHCYWMRVNKLVPTNSCTWNPSFDPGFVPPSTKPWSLTTSLDWLLSMLPGAGAAP